MKTAVKGAYNISVKAGEASRERSWLQPAEVEFLQCAPNGIAADTPVSAYLMSTESIVPYLWWTRQDRGISIGELSDESGIDSSIIYRAERGEENMRVPSLGMLYRALGGLLHIALTDKQEPERRILIPCDDDFPIVIGKCCREQRELRGIRVNTVIEQFVQAGRCSSASRDAVSRFETAKSGRVPLIGTVEANYAALAIAVQYCALPG